MFVSVLPFTNILKDPKNFDSVPIRSECDIYNTHNNDNDDNNNSYLYNRIADR